MERYFGSRVGSSARDRNVCIVLVYGNHYVIFRSLHRYYQMIDIYSINDIVIATRISLQDNLTIDK